MSWIIGPVLAIGALYLAIVAVMYFAQTRLIFPSWLTQLGRPELPSSAARLEVTTPEGVRLSGVRLPALGTPVRDRSILLGFPGNAWSAEAMALTLHRMVPDRDVIVFHYRGYRPSGGRPGAKAVLADSVTIFDRLQKELGTTPIIAVGVSIGSPVAAYVARERSLAGLILITPFDSLVELARAHYRWLPVRWLLRHRMPTVDFVHGRETPTALIAAAEDTIVPAARSEPLRRAIPNLVFDRTIAGADHNDLYDRPAFREALREALAQIAGQHRSGHPAKASIFTGTQSE